MGSLNRNYHLLKNNKPLVKRELVEHITQKLVFECPAHDFEIDYNLARKMNLPVELMNMTETKIAHKIIKNLRKLESAGEICQYIGRKNRLPFIKLYIHQN